MGLYAPKPERNFNIGSVEPSDLEIALLVKHTRFSFTDPPLLYSFIVLYLVGSNSYKFRKTSNTSRFFFLARFSYYLSSYASRTFAVIDLRKSIADGYARSKKIHLGCV